MTDRERLIELFKKIEFSPFPEITAKYKIADQFTNYALNSIVDEMIKNGVIMPPCKVGQTVYHRFGYSFVIEKIEVFDNKMLFRCGNIGTDDYMSFYADEIGKDVFLTREEVEKALAERSANND